MLSGVSHMNKSSIEELGGREMLEKAMKAFYDRVYEHPWIGLYFKDISQDVIEKQQVDFMIGALGGPKSAYSGRLPVDAHKNMFITDELFQVREELLLEAFAEVKAPQELIDRWLKIDNAFKSGIVKKSIEQCEKTFVTDDILDFPNPIKKVA
jgi:hemoglobin